MSHYYDESGDADTRAELLAERNASRRYFNACMAHPDPRDPDWPGHWVEEEDEANLEDDETEEGEDK